MATRAPAELLSGAESVRTHDAVGAARGTNVDEFSGEPTLVYAPRSVFRRWSERLYRQVPVSFDDAHYVDSLVLSLEKYQIRAEDRSPYIWAGHRSKGYKKGCVRQMLNVSQHFIKKCHSAGRIVEGDVRCDLVQIALGSRSESEVPHGMTVQFLRRASARALNRANTSRPSTGSPLSSPARISR